MREGSKKEASKIKQTTRQSNTAVPKKNELPRVGLEPTTHMYIIHVRIMPGFFSGALSQPLEGLVV